MRTPGPHHPAESPSGRGGLNLPQMWLGGGLVVGVTLLLCWWPLRFSVPNDVWINPVLGQAFFNLGKPIGRLYNRGLAFTAETVTLRPEEQLTVRIQLTPARNSRGLGCILMLYDGDNRAPLTIAQWQEHLALFRRAPLSPRGYREVGLREQLQIGQRIELTVTSTVRETWVLVDGQSVAHYPDFSLLDSGAVTQGRLLIGNNQFGSEPWRGRIERIALFRRAAGESPGIPSTGQPFLAYDFAAAGEGMVPNLAGDSHALLLPASFVPLARTFFAPLSAKSFTRSGALVDIYLNIFGFIPVGMVFALLAGRVFSAAWARLILPLVFALLFSLLIESVQGFLPLRHSSQLDVLCNTLGGLLAAFLFLALTPSLPHEQRFHP